MAARRLLFQDDDFNSDVEQKRRTTSTMMLLVGVKCSGASLPGGVTVQSRAGNDTAHCRSPKPQAVLWKMRPKRLLPSTTIMPYFRTPIAPHRLEV
jgi:hypothetical protein